MMGELLGLAMGLGYLGLSGWLTLKILKMFVGPLMTPLHPLAKMQFFITDYYVLLAQVGLMTGILAPKYRGDPDQLALLIAYSLAVGCFWFASTRMLSRQRVTKFWPRMVGQFLFPLQFCAALLYGFATLPWLILIFASPVFIAVVLGAIVIFAFLVWSFTQTTRWTLEHADPQPEPVEPQG